MLAFLVKLIHANTSCVDLKNLHYIRAQCNCKNIFTVVAVHSTAGSLTWEEIEPLIILRCCLSQEKLSARRYPSGLC